MGDGLNWDDMPTAMSGPGNLEAVTDAEYLEISDAAAYDQLMEHCAR